MKQRDLSSENLAHEEEASDSEGKELPLHLLQAGVGLLTHRGEQGKGKKWS